MSSAWSDDLNGSGPDLDVPNTGAIRPAAYNTINVCVGRAAAAESGESRRRDGNVRNGGGGERNVRAIGRCVRTTLTGDGGGLNGVYNAAAASFLLRSFPPTPFAAFSGNRLARHRRPAVRVGGRSGRRGSGGPA